MPSGPLGLTYDASQSESLLGGFSWDVSNALGLDVTGVNSQRSGVPLGFGNDAAIAPKASTQALSVDAHMDIGQGWVTTASFSDSLTQLDQRDNRRAPCMNNPIPSPSPSMACSAMTRWDFPSRGPRPAWPTLLPPA